jgi:hypothetical protein
VTVWRLSSLTREWVGPITVTADDTPVTAWTYRVMPWGDKPDTPESIDDTPTDLNGGLGVLVGPGSDNVLAVGEYQIWIRYVDSPEAPVLHDDMTIIIT